MCSLSPRARREEAEQETYRSCQLFLTKSHVSSISMKTWFYQRNKRCLSVQIVCTRTIFCFPNATKDSFFLYYTKVTLFKKQKIWDFFVSTFSNGPTKRWHLKWPCCSSSWTQTQSEILIFFEQNVKLKTYLNSSYFTICLEFSGSVLYPQDWHHDSLCLFSRSLSSWRRRHSSNE